MVRTDKGWPKVNQNQNRSRTSPKVIGPFSLLVLALNCPVTLTDLKDLHLPGGESESFPLAFIAKTRFLFSRRPFPFGAKHEFAFLPGLRLPGRMVG